MKTIAGLPVWLFLAAMAQGQPISVAPVSPTPADTVRVFAHSYFLIRSEAHQIVGNRISVQFEEDRFDWGPNPPMPPFISDLGSLPPGIYDIHATVGHGTSLSATFDAQLIVDAAAPALFGRLVKVAGDRQIRSGPNGTVGIPFVLHADDVTGNPLLGAYVVLAPPLSTPNDLCTSLRDEFGFAGFNVVPPGETCSWAPSGATNADGDVTIRRGDSNSPPSAFVFGARALAGATSGPMKAREQYFTIVHTVDVPPGSPEVVVEYFHPGLRHYFNTLNDAEVAALDNGTFAGWERGVGGFIAWPTKAAAPAGAVPVCRFFSSQLGSHFYSADAAECDAVTAYLPEWQLETREAYWLLLPNRSNGSCPAGFMPVYRVFNPASPNHRYVTDRTIREAMVRAGWIAEGYGSDAATMCTAR